MTSGQTWLIKDASVLGDAHADLLVSDGRWAGTPPCTPWPIPTLLPTPRAW